MKKENGKYGVITAIAMIVGVCIGSGIFFKSDNILIATGGSVPLGVLVFVLGAISIIFGGLCLSQLSSRTDRAGGVITYFEEFGSKRLACGFGWFQTFIYYPTLSAVVSWVIGIYLSILFAWDLSLELQILIGFAFLTICFIYNILSRRFGGAFQNVTTVIKLIPLISIAVLGLIFGNPLEGLRHASSSQVVGAAWITAVGPIAFSYDGWVVSTSIAHEIDKSKKNLSLALILAPIFVLIVYVMYFLGVTSYIGADKVMALGDEHVSYVASKLLGSFGAKAILVFVIISVMGTVNGLVLGFIRLPYSLSLRGSVLPFSKRLSTINERLGVSVHSAIYAYVIMVIWIIVHYLTTKLDLLPNSDISEISIAMSYLLYIILYYKVFKMYRVGEIKSPTMGIIVPIFATIGSLFILSGGLQSAFFAYYITFCIFIVLISFVYYNFKTRTQN